MSALLAFHGDPKVKARYLRRVRAHRKADAIVQGYGYWKDGKGCAVGCTLHSDKHSQYPVELGIPEELAYLEDHFFERLPQKVAREWPIRFLNAARTGANLSRIYDLWSAWNLDDPEHGVLRLVSEEFPDIRRIVKETADACRAGTRVDEAKRSEAAYAAYAADAADAARAARAARAAYAADAARAAYAAYAADAADAADAARAAYAAYAADAAYYERASNKLIELMEAA